MTRLRAPRDDAEERDAEDAIDRRRGCIVLRGDRDATRAEAARLVAALAGSDVLWVSAERDEPAPGSGAVHPSRVRARLGAAFDAVVLDLHDGLDADVLGQCEGMIWGGGRLVLRMPPEDAPPPEGPAALATYPYVRADVGTRSWRRFERCLARSSALVAARPVAPVPHDVRGTADQARAVAGLARILASPSPSMVALLADRGRGKSSAIGLALRELARAGDAAPRVVITAAHAGAAAEIFRFARADEDADDEDALVLVPPESLAQRPLRPSAAATARPDVIVVEEAAQLPVALLTRIALRHPRARIVLATTCRGYEGTGRGFVLRFLAWARAQERPLVELSLAPPIRWAEDDPLERLVMDALALDAEPASPATDEDDVDVDVGALEPVCLDRDALAADEPLLRDVFGLLVHAHYRTTPGDLQRALDAPNLELHALLHRAPERRARALAASVVSREGALPAALADELARGRARIHGHALPDTLIAHSGHAEAGRLRILRSVRVAVHPALRRRGAARRLIDHVHRAHPEADLFGTIFGATPELLRFRRALGYELARVGVSRGSRTGEPAAVMLRPVTAPAMRLLESLRLELARALPAQLALLDAGGELALDPELDLELRAGLPSPPPLDDAARDAIVARYLDGPAPYDAVAYALEPWVRAHAHALGSLDPRSHALIRARVLERAAWADVARAARAPSVAAAMRALRPALRALRAAIDRA